MASLHGRGPNVDRRGRARSGHVANAWPAPLGVAVGPILYRLRTGVVGRAVEAAARRRDDRNVIPQDVDSGT